MSQRGRSGFLSYLLLLSRVLRFEHRVEEVVGALGLPSRVRAQSRNTGALWPLPTFGFLLQPNSSSWRGELSGPGTTVLCLHGAQSNLSPLQLAVL